MRFNLFFSISASVHVILVYISYSLKLIFISSQAIRRVLHEEVLPHYKLHEFFTMDIEIILRDFKRAIEGSYMVVQIKYEVIR